MVPSVKLSLVYPEFLLRHRFPGLDFSALWTDPRGLTGSEVGLARIAEELVELGHDVTIYTQALDKQWGKVAIRPLDELPGPKVDATISFNDPRPLEQAHGLRVCPLWINSLEFAGPGKFWEHTDLWLSPSGGHRDFMMSKPHDIWQPGTADVIAHYEPEPEKWEVVELGCDPGRYGLTDKTPGQVIYCSSPDRGLHLLLEQWPRIYRAVPHARLKVFYRLKPWLDGWHEAPYIASTNGLRARAAYIEEALRRMLPRRTGIEICDSVSRRQMEFEQNKAECLAYPCNPVNAFTEGFSCSTLEGCAAQAAPVVSDADALGGIYRDACSVIPRGQWDQFGDMVIRTLTDKQYRDSVNERALAFGKAHTWKATAKRMEELILARLSANR